MGYINFFLKNKRLISFGFMLTFFSSFGQTFLISLYVPEIIKEFNFSSFSFGMIYGAATVSSGFTLAFVGKFIDNSDLRKYTLSAVLLLTASCLLLGFSFNAVLVFLGFWGLRLAGQGLFTHISSTSMSKLFHDTRGKALSLSVLGHSAGESVLPSMIGFLIGYIGWRASMVVSASAAAVLLAPFIFFMLAGENVRFGAGGDRSVTGAGFSRWELVRDKKFYIIAANPFVLYFTITGLFFYQLILAQEKGWSVEWIAASFFGFALGRTVFSFISGKLIDKFTPLKIFPAYLIPLIIGLLTLSIFSDPIIAPFYFILIGISVGLSSTLNTAVLAEVYGTSSLGGIRAALSFLSVFSTALSPALFGFLLDRGFSFTFLVVGSATAALMAVIITSRLPGIVRSSKEPSFG